MIALELYSLTTCWLVIAGLGVITAVLVHLDDRAFDRDLEDLRHHEDERQAMARVASRCRAHHPSTTHSTTPEHYR